MEPKSFTEAESILTGRCKNRRKLANNTYLERRNGNIAVRLHNTDIVIYHQDGIITLNTNGWTTPTTKDRLNRFSPAMIWQENSVWYVSASYERGARYLFTDNMRVNVHGKPLDAKLETKADRKAIRDLKRKIAKFAKLCADNCIGVRPSNGDCFICQVIVKTTPQSVGIRHLESHMDEKYPVPSLIYRAVERFGASQATKSVLYHGEPDCFIDHAKQSINKCVRRYMYERFGLAS